MTASVLKGNAALYYAFATKSKKIMTKCIGFFLALLIPLCLLADEVIEVPLATKQNLTPIYLGKITSDEAGFSSEGIYDVLAFDLHHSGFSYLVSSDPEK